jgi:hypothetical protein
MTPPRPWLSTKKATFGHSNTSPGFPVPKIPPGISPMEQFKIIAGAVIRYPKPTGIGSMFRHRTTA